jgi:hypothetical protein
MFFQTIVFNFVTKLKNIHMKFKLIEIPYLSGRRCKFYSIQVDGDNKTLFERFTEENGEDFNEEVLNILKNLRNISSYHGARDYYFRPKKEGKLGDGVEALFDEPKANLRVYCIKYGQVLLVLGGGGHKPKSIRTFQEDIKLTKENYLMRQIADILYKAIRDKDLRWNRQGDDFEGQFYFDSEDY